MPFGKARVRREGNDLTIVAYGTTVHFALEAAAELAKEGKEVEVVDLRSLVPLDIDAVTRSVQEDEPRARRARGQGPRRFRGRDRLSDPGGSASRTWTRRSAASGSTFTPVGFNRILERAVLPSTERLLEGARKVLAY